MNDSSQRRWPKRYWMLDGLRALAALVVVCQHLQIGEEYNIGHMAVMVFFVISGYCIAATSESCLVYGHGFKIYMNRRVRRIYPPYFLAVCFFVATRLVKWKLGGGMRLSSSLTVWLQNITLTQWFSLLGHPLSYAANNRALWVSAFWSLNYEEQFYLVIGVLMVLSVRFSRPILWGVLGLLIPAFAWNLTHPSISYGFFLEYWVHFSLGALVFYRLCTVTKGAAHRAVDLGLLILATSSGIVWWLNKGPGFAEQRSVYAEWFITSTFALFLIAVRSWDAVLGKSRLGSMLMKFGALTYSLYLIHQFNLEASYRAAGLLLRIGVPYVFKIPLEIAVMVLIAAVFWYFCERPFINKPLGRPRVRMAAAVSRI